MANIDQLIFENPHIILKCVHLINSMAFKNSMDMRKQMKNLKLFDMRDDLIIRAIKYCSQLELVIMLFFI
jgi:hypothetical protein